MTSRRLSASLLSQIGAVAVALLIMYWFLQVRSVPDAVLSQRECQRAYQEARTLSDTQEVDFREPLMQRRERGGQPLNCGAIRRAGRLPP
jgi:hypothetical protein